MVAVPRFTGPASATLGGPQRTGAEYKGVSMKRGPYDMDQSHSATCPACGKRYRRHDSGRRGEYCSDACEDSMPFPRIPSVSAAAFERAVTMYPNQKRAAEALGVSYVRFRRVVQAMGLREIFPPQGGAATWAE